MLIVYTNMLVFSLNKTINIKCFTRTWMTLPNVTARIGPMMGDTSLRDRESGRAGERERGREGERERGREGEGVSVLRWGCE
jgi:hypothetical protein